MSSAKRAHKEMTKSFGHKDHLDKKENLKVNLNIQNMDDELNDKKISNSMMN